MIHINEGSTWEKWDLHLHAPSTQLNDGYKSSAGINVLEKFCDELENSDVLVFGITDYFSVKSYKSFIDAFQKKYPKSKKQFFFNLELRLNETVNAELEEVNLHLIFNPVSLLLIDKFLNRLEITKTGKDGVAIICSDLKTDDEFKSATVTRQSITQAFHDTYGKDAIRENHFLVFTAANNDGLRPERGKMRKNELCDEIDKFSDGFIGSSANPSHFLKTDRLEDKGQYIKPKPVITGSDAHSFEAIASYLGKTVKSTKGVNGATESILKETSWIKADPTFEGLKQIIYEPVPGERVLIASTKPDQKDDFKVIKQISFPGSKDFPGEIVFNGNLSSIIGSRSSGKSALLAYIAYAVDKTDTKSKTKGPGDGEAFHWEKIGALTYTVKWANGKTTTESQGKVIYLPQNYLFEKSKEAKEVKARIAPVLFNVNPSFKSEYDSTNTKIDELNIAIDQSVDFWFVIRESLTTNELELKDIGDKDSIEEERKSLEAKIKDLKDKNKFEESDLTKYRLVTQQIQDNENRIKDIELEQGFFNFPSGQTNLFEEITINSKPRISILPVKLQDKINEKLSTSSNQILAEINKVGLEYKIELDTEKSKLGSEIQKARDENKELIERYRNDEVLQQLMKDLARQMDALAAIAVKEQNITKIKESLLVTETSIRDNMEIRLQKVEALKKFIDSSTEKQISGIEFGMEYDVDKADINNLFAKINAREKTDFVEQNDLLFPKIRETPNKFLEAIFTKNQKVIQHYDPIDVVKNAFHITEKILFTANMEGDKIGGFHEPTMTAGKRALFALRLILAESKDQWPLLIDQPEDDLDSRSIYDEIVPFLKQKKKERQIIMVSHNANLVVGADSEQLVIANRHGNDRQNENGKQFNYLTGSIEFTKDYDDKCKDTLHSQGVCEHACAILDGGKTAFENRKNRYNLK